MDPEREKHITQHLAEESPLDFDPEAHAEYLAQRQTLERQLTRAWTGKCRKAVQRPGRCEVTHRALSERAHRQGRGRLTAFRDDGFRRSTVRAWRRKLSQWKNARHNGKPLPF